MAFNKDLVKGIIFDYGGTIDSCGDHWSEVIWEAYQKADVLPPKPLFRDAYVYAERELARVMHILPQHDFKDLMLIKVKIELQYLANQEAFPPQQIDLKAAEIAEYCDSYALSCVEKATPVLQTLAAHYPLVLVSNFYGNVQTVLQRYGIDRYFKKVIESAVVGVRKPDPEIFRLGVKALDLPAENVLVVGDSYRKDIAPSVEAGCQAVWIKGKPWKEEDNAADYSPSITDLQQLLTLLNIN